MSKSFLQGSIIPFAKFSGITSFSALGQIKRALGTKKVGHTGTLDSFADGLLVAVVGKYTKLARYITNCDKEYLARFTFGKQTDTLDPTGKVILECDLPSLESFFVSLSKFIGKIDQIPPKYSAVHVNGKRASEIIRGGNVIELQPREIEVFSIDVINYSTDICNSDNPKLKEVVLKIACSKGTYIRSLARDIGLVCSSCGYVSALRRLSIGNFKLVDAVGYENLPDFLEESRDLSDVNPISVDAFFKGRVVFSKDVVQKTGLGILNLKVDFLDFFETGRLIKDFWFENVYKCNNKQYAVFCVGLFCGIVSFTNGRYEYENVFLSRGSK